MKRRLLAALPLLVLLGCPKSGPNASPASAPATSSTPPAASAPAPSSPAPTPVKAGKGAPCVSSQACESGLVCTTEAGACERPPGCGPDDICMKVCYGVCEAPGAKAKLPGCQADADCKAHSSYCGGCACLGLLEKVAAPKCSDRPVNCIMDPCQNKVARCLEGRCVVRDAAPAK